MNPNRAKANSSRPTGYKAKVEDRRITGYQKAGADDGSGKLVAPINKDYRNSNATELQAAKLSKGKTLSPSVQAHLRKK